MSYDYPEPQAEVMEPVFNVIDILPYDYGQEVSNLNEALDKWNARAASRPPFKPTRQPDHPANPRSETSISDWHSQGTGPRRDFWSGLPDNIVYQIISHLYPRDVLALARVNKGTRHKLMSRDSRDLWTSVLRRTHGLPPCPPHMAEPHYVALIFENTCMGCGLRESTFSSIALGWRLCAPCSWANLVPEYEVKNHFIKALHANDVLNYHIVQEFRVKHVLPYFSVATSEGDTRLYYQPEVELFLAECLPIVVRLLHQGDARASAALWAIIRSRGDFVARSHELAAAVESWVDRIRRPPPFFQQILERPEMRPYTPADFPQGIQSFDDALNSRRLLTDELWSRLGAILLPVMEANRARRVGERQNLGADYYSVEDEPLW